jgi:hypothetical protein
VHFKASIAGLPDGLFSNQKSQYGYILEGRGMETVGSFMTIWNILRPFGKFIGSLVCLDRAKSVNPAIEAFHFAS